MADRQAQQRQLYSEVFDEHGAGLARVVGAYAHRQEDKEDLRQELALAVWRALPGFRGEASVKTFAYRIATNLSISYLRRRRQTVAHVQVRDDGPSPEELLTKADERQRLHRAIRDLPLGTRQAVLLRLEGLTYAEIGSVLGLNEKAVSVRLTRGRKKLRQTMQEQA